jgi:enoyl-CoA hydratase/carnithine racemase
MIHIVDRSRCDRSRRVFELTSVHPDSVRSGRGRNARHRGASSLNQRAVLFVASFDTSLETQMEYERQFLVECSHTADFQEGIGAFLAKKPASFHGV